MTIEVNICHRLGRFRLDARFVSSGRLTALFGPSGSGKTSVVNAIGGLIRPDQGRIAVDGRILFDRQAGINVPKHRRRIGYVFQEPRLFPHMSVRRNLAYGRWFAPRGERSSDIGHVVELLGIGHLLDRMPNLLSGGEKQRVAIGRALLASPRLLLMDEPLASLDQMRKAEIMPYIERLRDEMRTPIVYVSHSIAEVARLATDIAVMADGRIVASGATEAVLQRLDLFADGEKDEAGAVIEATIAGYDQEFDMSVLASPAGEFRLAGKLGEPGRAYRLRLRARDVMIATREPRGISALNVLRGTVAEIGAPVGASVDIRIDCGGVAVISRITRLSLQSLRLKIGTRVFAVVKTVSFDSSNIAPGPLAKR